jgi:hypothetical protein
MACAEIDLTTIKAVVNAVLDHMVEDLQMEKIQLDDQEDFYWSCPDSELYDMSKKPVGMDIGRLSDDVDFVNLIQRGQGGDVSYNLVHIAPLLRYLAEKIKQ